MSGNRLRGRRSSGHRLLCRSRDPTDPYPSGHDEQKGSRNRRPQATGSRLSVEGRSRGGGQALRRFHGRDGRSGKPGELATERLHKFAYRLESLLGLLAHRAHQGVRQPFVDVRAVVFQVGRRLHAVHADELT